MLWYGIRARATTQRRPPHGSLKVFSELCNRLRWDGFGRLGYQPVTRPERSRRLPGVWPDRPYAVARSIALDIEVQLETNAHTDSTMLDAGKFRETYPTRSVCRLLIHCARTREVGAIRT